MAEYALGGISNQIFASQMENELPGRRKPLTTPPRLFQDQQEKCSNHPDCQLCVKECSV